MSTNKSILRNYNDNLKINKYGFVKINNFIEKNTLDKIKQLYYEKLITKENSFYTTHMEESVEYKYKVFKTVHGYLNQICDNTFNDYKIVMVNFMAKESGLNSEMSLHADWQLVNESTSRSVSIWIPLVNTNETNGCLGVIPYSHNLIDNSIRGPKIKSSVLNYNSVLIEKSGKLLPMKLGSAIIYDSKLLHYSPANLSDKTRIAINVILVPNNQKIHHFTSYDGIEVHEFQDCDIDFFINYTIFQKPSNKYYRKKFIYSKNDISKEEIDSFLSKRTRLNIIEILKKLKMFK